MYEKIMALSIDEVADGKATIGKQMFHGHIMMKTFVILFAVLIFSCVIAHADVPISEDCFPDTLFRSRVSEFDSNMDGILSDEEISQITEISFSRESPVSLKGIEYFSALTKMTVNYTEIDSLDLSNNINLTELNCSNNSLSSLVLGNNNNLSRLICTNNSLKQLDISGCSTLVNKMMQGNISSDEILYISSDDDPNFSFSVDRTIKLITGIDFDDIQINAKNFPDKYFRSIIKDRVDKNNDDLISYFELHSLKRLPSQVDEFRDVANIKGIEYFTDLTYLNLSGSKVASVDLSNNKKLEELNCSNCRLSALNISNCPNLVLLDCGGNNISKLDLRSNKKLEELFCSNNKLQSLSLASCKGLRKLYCADNQLTNLDLSKNTLLEELVCSRNNLATLNVKGCKNINYLLCSRNSLKTMDISSLSKLGRLECSSNSLEALDCSKNTSLKYLECNYNRLSTLKLGKNKKLQSLYCDHNRLLKLDISKCPDLIYLINSVSGSDYSNWLFFKSDNQSLYFSVDKCVTVKAGKTTIKPTGEPYLEGEYTDSLGKYEIQYDNTAIFITPVDKKITQLKIPDTITVMKVKVKVVKIAENACKGFKKLTKLEIGNNVEEIGASAFQDCKNLKEITVRSSLIQEYFFGWQSFKNIHKDAVIKCPPLKLEKYTKWFRYYGGVPSSVKIQ